MVHLQEIVIARAIGFLKAYFGSISDNPLQSCKRHFPYEAISICDAFSRTYIFRSSVLPILDNASDLIDVVKETRERISIPPVDRGSTNP